MFGAIGILLKLLTGPQLIELAGRAPKIIADAKRLEEDVEPIIAEILDNLKDHPDGAVAHAHWSAAWTAANQRAADFQDGSRG